MRAMILASLLCLALPACQDTPEEAFTPLAPRAPPRRPEPPRDELDLQPAETPGVVAGVVIFPRETPPPVMVEVTWAQEICGRQRKIEKLTTGPGGGVEHVVVELLAKTTPGEALVVEHDSRQRTLTHRACALEPFVQAATVGDTLLVTNADRILHVAHAFIGSETVFRHAFPLRAKPATWSLERTGIVEVGSDLGRAWMRAFIYVSPSPYLATTGADGSFTIEAPPGRYDLKLWHPHLPHVHREDLEIPPTGARLRYVY